MEFSLVKHVIYEDDDIIAINKPAGVVVHPDAHHSSGTVSDAVVARYPEIKNVGDDPIRPGIVHRLDKDTSGILIVAKNQRAFECLKKEFQERRIVKNYITLAVGEIKQNEGEITLPIGRGYKTPTRRTATGRTRGTVREAVTRFRVLEHLPGLTLLSVTPKTGRTHQIRAHLQAIGHPVACDKLYGGKLFVCPAGLSRQFLHAASLELTLPSGSRMKFEAELPKDLENVLSHLHGIQPVA